MDKALLSPIKTFRTTCRSPCLGTRLWVCLIGYVLLCAAAAGAAGSSPRLITYRPVYVDRDTDGGAFVVASGEETVLLLYGEGFTNETRLWLSDRASCSHDNVNLHSLGPVHMHSDNGTWANITVSMSTSEKSEFHFCISASDANDAAKELQGEGDDPTLKLIIDVDKPKSELLPLPVKIVFIVILILLSGMFSGLNLGLMSLDPTTLKLVMESGSKKQRIYAKLIYRVRRYGNYLLCTLLLGNVLVNNTLTILLENVLGDGVIAIVASTIAIVIFGEIIPQAICSRHALTIGAYTIWLTYIFMVVTFPLSLPISLILHFILGKEIGAVYTRDELLGLLKVTQDHHDIGSDEVQIISGALKFKGKTAEDVMTRFEYVYCLDIQSVLGFKTIREIYDSGFSRIPVYEEVKSNIVGVLYAKDLAFVDPDDETPLKQVLNFYNRELTSVYDDTKLNELLEEFAGGKCHLALVNRVNKEGPGDPQLEVIGVVTLEDIVEEILQLEIVDETDRIMDNRSQKPRQRKQVDIGEFVDDTPPDRPHLSSQQKLAIYQFLSSSINAFKCGVVLPGILKQLLNRDVVRRVALEEAQSRNHPLYSTNSPASAFTMVIEGHVEVEVGRDGMTFEAGPFHYFGVQALESDAGDYVPDFTVRPTTDCLFLVITHSQYLEARRATQFQQTKDIETSPNPINNHKHLSLPAQPKTTDSSCITPSPQHKFLGAAKKRQRRPSEPKDLEVQRLLTDSSSSSESEEGDSGEFDKAGTPASHSLGSLSAAGGGAVSVVTVEVEMHDIARDGAGQRENGGPIEQKLTLAEEPSSLDSSSQV